MTELAIPRPDAVPSAHLRRPVLFSPVVMDLGRMNIRTGMTVYQNLDPAILQRYRKGLT